MVERKTTEPVVGAMETRYPRQELVAQSEAIFGVKPEVVVGALHGNTATELTVGEVRSAVAAFLKRGVR